MPRDLPVASAQLPMCELEWGARPLREVRSGPNYSELRRTQDGCGNCGNLRLGALRRRCSPHGHQRNSQRIWWWRARSGAKFASGRDADRAAAGPVGSPMPAGPGDADAIPSGVLVQITSASRRSSPTTRRRPYRCAGRAGREKQEFLALYLASSASDYVTGQTILLDGGLGL